MEVIERKFLDDYKWVRILLATGEEEKGQIVSYDENVIKLMSVKEKTNVLIFKSKIVKIIPDKEQRRSS